MIRRNTNRSYTIIGWICLSLLLISFSPALMAQEKLGRGRMNGDVKDESGAPLAGVLISAKNLETPTVLEGKTDKKGHFAIAGFGTGQWNFTVSLEGYVSVSRVENVRQLATNPPLEFTLKKVTGINALLTDKTGIESFDKANALVEAGRYDEAIKMYQEFMTKYPEVYQTRLNIAAAYVKKGDMAAAEQEYKAVLEKAIPADGLSKKDNTSAVRALSGLGELYLKKGDFETGQKYFAQALAISPEDEAAAYNVGEIFFSNQKLDEALTYFQMATKIKPTWSLPYYKIGLVYLNKGDYPKAIEYLKKFVEMDPQNPEVATVNSIIATIEKMKS